MDYDDHQEVKDVYVTVLFKVKARMTLLGADYNESDGTDKGAVMAALLEDGIPSDFDVMEPHTIISVTDCL
jgi:hypothetical protein